MPFWRTSSFGWPWTWLQWIDPVEPELETGKGEANFEGGGRFDCGCAGLYRAFFESDEASLLTPSGGVKGFLFDENVPRQILISTDFPALHAVELADSTSDREI